MVFLSYEFNYGSEELKKLICLPTIPGFDFVLPQANLMNICNGLCRWLSAELLNVGIKTKKYTDKDNLGKIYIDTRHFPEQCFGFGETTREYDVKKPHFEIIPNKDGDIAELRIRQITHCNRDAVDTVDRKFEAKFRKLFKTLEDRGLAKHSLI